MAKLFDDTKKQESILEPCKFLFYDDAGMLLLYEEIIKKRRYLAYCEYKE